MEKEIEKLYEELKDLLDSDNKEELEKIIKKEKDNYKVYDRKVADRKVTRTDEEKKEVYKERIGTTKEEVIKLLESSEIAFVALSDRGCVSTGSLGDIINLLGLMVNELVNEFDIPKEEIYNRIDKIMED